MDDKQFDEMQIKIRNKIGNQMFSVMVMLILLDSLAYFLGLRWIAYPYDIQIIALICCAIYEIRLSVKDSLFGRKQLSGRAITTVSGVSITTFIITTIVCLIVVVIIGCFFQTKSSINTSHIGPVPNIIMQVVSVGAIVFVLVSQYVRQHHDD